MVSVQQTPRFGSLVLIPQRDFAEIHKVERAGGHYWQAPVTDFTVYLKPSTADAFQQAETVRRRDELVAAQKKRKLEAHEEYTLDRYNRTLATEGEGTIYYAGTVLTPHDPRVAQLARQLAEVDSRRGDGKYVDPTHTDTTRILKGYGDAANLGARLNIREVLSQVIAEADTSKAQAGLGGLPITGLFQRFKPFLQRTVEQGKLEQSFSTHNGGETQENFLRFEHKCPDAPPSHDD